MLQKVSIYFKALFDFEASNSLNNAVKTWHHLKTRRVVAEKLYNETFLQSTNAASTKVKNLMHRENHMQELQTPQAPVGTGSFKTA